MKGYPEAPSTPIPAIPALWVLGTTRHGHQFRSSQRHGPWHRDGDGEWQSDRPQQSVLPANRAGLRPPASGWPVLIAGGSVLGYVSFYRSSSMIPLPRGVRCHHAGPPMTRPLNRAASVRLKVAASSSVEVGTLPTGHRRDLRSGHGPMHAHREHALPKVGAQGPASGEWAGPDRGWLPDGAAQYFDPAQGKFFYGPMMPSARASMAVTKLKNGDVFLQAAITGLSQSCRRA